MENLGVVLFAIFIVLVIFLVIREVVCWYFKINKQIELMRMMLQTMLKIYEKEGGEVNWEEAKKHLM